ncbi:MAG: N-acetylmuramoyl-L-alanine amidase [Clostridia bacterium]|nr:N-acetylmuramoyl-L-alanine amidase [Clostridia bacterium]
MKRTVSIFLAALMLFSLSARTAFAAGTGDVDGNGRITSADARLALRISALLEQPDEETALRADVDRSGRVSASDARIILRVAAKLQATPEDDAVAPADTGETVTLPPGLLQRAASLDSYYASGDRGLLTPFRDNGLGKARMCEILLNKEETSDAADRTDKSNIFCSPLSKGTIDYVVGEQTFEGKKMYVLSCGRKVYAKDARLLPSGYILPPNRLTAGETVYGENTTDFYLDTLWAVPAGICVGPQEYHTGYMDRRFNVSSFTAAYFDVIFYNTPAFSGDFSLPRNDFIGSVAWIDNGNGSVALRFRLRRPGGFCGCCVDLTDDGRFCISVKNVTVRQRTVVIDAGHGGKDTGAPGFSAAVPEAAINLAIASQTARELRSRGIRVITVRTTDEAHSREERTLFSRYFKPDAYVSVHNDYIDDPSITGTHAFYYYPWSMPLADSIHRHMVAAYREKIYAPGTNAYAHADRGVHFYPFHVTRVEECPAVLVECGYVSNAAEYGVLCAPANQKILAAAIADGIVGYLDSLDGM